MKEKSTVIKDLKSYIGRATSPYHVIIESASLLENEGFERLDFSSEWELEKGKSYYTVSYDTTLFAFTIGENFKEGSSFHIACGHTDYPCLHVKPRPEISDNGYLKLNTEVYGGAIFNTWLDRPLSIAGKVMTKSDDIYHPMCHFVDVKKSLLTIPNLAIHMNRDVNRGTSINQQNEMLPIIGLIDDTLSKDSFFINLLAKECKVDPKDILDFDIVVYNAEEGSVIGLENELFSSPRLDNLTSCYACLKAIASSKNASEKNSRTNLIALFDNEEIGSRTKQGADSLIMNILLEKIYYGLSLNIKRLNDSILESMMLSADVAHAYHPNYGSKSDPVLKVKCGEGVALKLSYSQKYATDTEAVAIIEQLCSKNGIAYQKFVNRSDIPGGSTLGTITSAYLPMKTVDIGVPILAMHSARELMGVKDEEAICDLIYCFFL